MIITVCAFCLANDRILTLIDEKYWKIVDFCINTSEEDDEIEYLQCLQRKQALQICWECGTKLKNFHQFISTSQQCVRVLNTYLEASTQTLPPSTSKLCRTHIAIVDTGSKYEETQTEDMAGTIDARLIYEETKTEDVTDTETEDVGDTMYTKPTEDITDIVDIERIYEETEIEDVTETSDVKMEDDPLETLSATTSKLYRNQTEDIANTIDAAQIFEKTKTEDLDIGPIYEETEADDVTETSDVKMENESFETELNDIPDNSNGEVIISDIREDPCTSVDLEMIKEQVVWWRVIPHRLPTDTLPANIMSSDAPFTICDGTNNSRIEATEHVPRVEALIDATDCISKQRTTKNNEEIISKKDKVINNKTTVFQIPEQNKGVSKSYICGHCKQKFYTKMKLQQHISIHYGVSGVSEVNLTCQTCNYKGVSVQALEKHSRLHDEKRRFKCNSCTYRFRSNRELMRHVQTHTAEKQYKCDLCDYACRSSSDLKKHMRIHTGEKQYKCDFCDYASNFSNALRNHVRIHTGNTYKCHLCDFASIQSGHLKSHMRKHTGEKPYKCDFCDYASSFSSALKTHVRQHTGEKPFKCELCGYRCIQSSDIRRHKKRQHAASSAT